MTAITVSTFPSPFSERYSNSKVPSFILSANPENIINDNSFNMQVQNIFESSQLKQFYAPQVDTLPFYGAPTKAYLLDNYTRFTTMEEVLREYVTDIAISKRRGKFNIRMFNGVKPIDGNPIVLLDGTPIFDIDNIFHIDPLKIRKLEVVANQYLYGPVVFNGIMSFISYKQDMTGFEIDPHAVILDYEALQSERKFYSPVYESDKQINSTIPDFRTALYWNPALITDGRGKQELIFYTGDTAGRYIGVIEGITANGEAGSSYFTFEINR